MTKQLTQEGYDKLKKELEELKAERVDIADRLKKAISYGDLSENADYHQAKEDQSFLEGRIVDIEAILRNAVIIKKNGGSKGEVQIGTTVTVESRGSKDNFILVGAAEANIMEGKISIESPLGKALIGKKEGEEAQFKMPNGRAVHYKIIKIV